MTDVLVTVILPIYKTEKYLDRCIESVVSQTYKNIEILLMDDGSPDSCPQICDAWATRDSRIRVVHRENGGLADVRNHAMSIVKGDYFCFVDSDDYIAPNMVEKCVERLVATNAQIAIFGLCNVNTNGQIVDEKKPLTGEITYRGAQVTEEFLPEILAPNPKTGVKLFYLSPCTTMYSTKTIKASGWQFISEKKVISEDVYSLLDMYHCIDSVTVIPQTFYYYCDNEASTSRSYRADRYEKTRIFYLEALALCDRLGYNEEVKRRVSKIFSVFTIGVLKQEFAEYPTFKEKYKHIRTIVSDDLLQNVLRQNRRDNDCLTRKILFFAMRSRMYTLCLILLKAKS